MKRKAKQRSDARASEKQVTSSRHQQALPNNAIKADNRELKKADEPSVKSRHGEQSIGQWLAFPQNEP